MNRKSIYLIMLLAAMVLLAGCTKKVTAPAVQQAGADGVVTELTPGDAVSVIDMTDVDELLIRARNAGAAGRFDEADSLLREASAFLRRNSRPSGLVDRDERSRQAIQSHVAEIITIYDEQMPPSYATPEDVSDMIFELHILDAVLEKLKVSPQDSIFLRRLRDKREAQYDVPVVLNDRVAAFLLHFMRNRDNVERWLERASYYLPVMKKMFAEAGLPQDLAYLPIIESGFRPKVVSSAKAKGIWQFIPSTGKQYGLRQNYWIDERSDPLRSTEAAIKYLGKLYGDFGHWYLALAAYNRGEGGLARDIQRAGGTRDYWALSLNSETRNYVPLYLASLIIAKNPDVFDFAVSNTEIYDPDIVSVSDCIALDVIASGINLPLGKLIEMNPHILRGNTPPDIKDVRLYLPKGYAAAFKEFYDNLPSEEMLRMAAIAKASAGSVTVETEASGIGGSKATAKKITHKVRKGETVYSISQKYGVPQKDLMVWNNLRSARSLQAGQTLVINVQAVPKQAAGVHIVQRGETLDGISRKLGVPKNELAQMNRLDPNKPRLYVGDRLSYPVKEQPKTATTQTQQPSQSAVVRQPEQQPAPSVAIEQPVTPQQIEPSEQPLPSVAVVEEPVLPEEPVSSVDADESVPSEEPVSYAKVQESIHYEEERALNAVDEQQAETEPPAAPDLSEQTTGQVAQPVQPARSLQPALPVQQAPPVQSAQSAPPVQPVAAVSRPAQPAPSKPELAVPEPPKQPAPPPAPKTAAVETAGKITFNARKGNSLEGIAYTYDVTVDDLRAWNRFLAARGLQVGDKLTVHVKGFNPNQTYSGRHAVKRGQTLFSIAQDLGISVKELAMINGLDAKNPNIFLGETLKYASNSGQANSQASMASPKPEQSRKVRYTVKNNDTLWGISQQFGTTVKAIREENGLSARSVIKAGTVLTITPGGQ